jgi:hypothetical protein
MNPYLERAKNYFITHTWRQIVEHIIYSIVALVSVYVLFRIVLVLIKLRL